MVKLRPHALYRVRGMEMYLYYQDGELLTFYYAIQFCGQRRLIYYRYDKLTESDIEEIKDKSYETRTEEVETNASTVRAL